MGSRLLGAALLLSPPYQLQHSGLHQPDPRWPFGDGRHLQQERGRKWRAEQAWGIGFRIGVRRSLPATALTPAVPRERMIEGEGALAESGDGI